MDFCASKVSSVLDQHLVQLVEHLSKRDVDRGARNHKLLHRRLHGTFGCGDKSKPLNRVDNPHMRHTHAERVVAPLLHRVKRVAGREHFDTDEGRHRQHRVARVRAALGTNIRDPHPVARNPDPQFGSRNSPPQPAVAIKDCRKDRLREDVHDLAQIALLHLSIDIVAIRPIGRVQVFAQRDQNRACHASSIVLSGRYSNGIRRRKIESIDFAAETELFLPEQKPDTIFDALVIGGGPAGYTFAIRASQFGLKTALIDANERLGGTCLLWGCIPTKAMLFSAELFDHLKHAEKYGIDGVSDPKLNWKNLLARKDDVIMRHTKGLDFLMKKNKITAIKGYARLTGPAKENVHSVEVKSADGKTQIIKAKKVVLALGSDARMLPGYTPDDTIMTNIEILKTPTFPKSLVVIGAGAVGVEFASVFKSFGAEVTIIEALPRLVNVEDEDVSKELLRLYKKRGFDIHLSAKVDKLEKNKDGVLVHFTTADGKGATKQAEKVLVAVGRAPRTFDAGLDKTNIVLDRGFIPVNEWMETTEPGIYAIGDIVAGLPQLAHVGGMSGLVVAARLAGKYSKPVRRNRIPGCTYCDPQIGSVGLTEAQAKAQGHQVKVGKFPFVGNSKATILDAHDGFVKVVADAKYGEILGVHIIGPYATEIIAECVTAIELEATVEEMMFTVHAHPTVAEALLDGFSSVEGLAVNV